MYELIMNMFYPKYLQKSVNYDLIHALMTGYPLFRIKARKLVIQLLTITDLICFKI